jgi:hypothetical protein
MLHEGFKSRMVTLLALQTAGALALVAAFAGTDRPPEWGWIVAAIVSGGAGGGGIVTWLRTRQQVRMMETNTTEQERLT